MVVPGGGAFSYERGTPVNFGAGIHVMVPREETMVQKLKLTLVDA